MLDVLIVVRDVLFAVLMSWAGLDGEDKRSAPESGNASAIQTAPLMPMKISEAAPVAIAPTRSMAACQA